MKRVGEGVVLRSGLSGVQSMPPSEHTYHELSILSIQDIRAV